MFPLGDWAYTPFSLISFRVDSATARARSAVTMKETRFWYQTYFRQGRASCKKTLTLAKGFSLPRASCIAPPRKRSRNRCATAMSA